MDKAVILGAGTYSQVYAEYIRDTERFELIGFLDDDDEKEGNQYVGLYVIGKIGNLEILNSLDINVVFAPIGDNYVRTKLIKRAQELGYETPNFIHPSSNIHSSVDIGKAVYILPGCNIMPHVCISDFVMISMGVNIAHHVFLDEGCFLSTGVCIGASVKISESVFVGMSACVMTGVNFVNPDSIIGAGAVVIRDVPESAVIIGNPGKILRYRD